jgi:hypothetical protein
LLTALPDELGQLLALSYLHVTFCPLLSALPASIGHLTNLRSLSLMGCHRLTDLPVTICNLTALSYLNLVFCDLLQPYMFASSPPASLALQNFKELARHVVNMMSVRYHPAKLLTLVLIARRWRHRHLPDELWTQLIRDEYLATDAVR